MAGATAGWDVSQITGPRVYISHTEDYADA
jgi:hypothetical protein